MPASFLADEQEVKASGYLKQKTKKNPNRIACFVYTIGNYPKGNEWIIYL